MYLWPLTTTHSQTNVQSKIYFSTFDTQKENRKCNKKLKTKSALKFRSARGRDMHGQPLKRRSGIISYYTLHEQEQGNELYKCCGRRGDEG